MLNKNLSLSEHIFAKNIEMIAVRDGFGKGLVLAGEENPNVVALTADLEESTRVNWFAEKFPERFIECGVAEQSMVTISAGMANYGKIPFIASYAVFCPGRTWEQIRTTVCLNQVPVKIYGGHVGLTVGPDGANHQMLEDIALMRVLPHMTVIAPSDAIEAQKAVLAASKLNGPVYLRIPRVESPVYTTEDTPFEIGKANILWEEKDPHVAIITHGVMVYEALKAAKKLSKLGINSIVVNSHTIKPLDTQTILKVAKLTGAIVVAEEHQKAGGLGGAVAEFLGEQYAVPLEIVAVNDSFGESGKPAELLEKYGLTAESICTAVKKVVKRKNS